MREHRRLLLGGRERVQRRRLGADGESEHSLANAETHSFADAKTHSFADAEAHSFANAETHSFADAEACSNKGPDISTAPQSSTYFATRFYS